MDPPSEIKVAGPPTLQDMLDLVLSRSDPAERKVDLLTAISLFPESDQLLLLYYQLSDKEKNWKVASSVLLKLLDKPAITPKMLPVLLSKFSGLLVHRRVGNAEIVEFPAAAAVASKASAGFSTDPFFSHYDPATIRRLLSVCLDHLLAERQLVPACAFATLLRTWHPTERDYWERGCEVLLECEKMARDTDDWVLSTYYRELFADHYSASDFLMADAARVGAWLPLLVELWAGRAQDSDWARLSALLRRLAAGGRYEAALGTEDVLGPRAAQALKAVGSLLRQGSADPRFEFHFAASALFFALGRYRAFADGAGERADMVLLLGTPTGQQHGNGADGVKRRKLRGDRPLDSAAASGPADAAALADLSLALEAQQLLSLLPGSAPVAASFPRLAASQWFRVAFADLNFHSRAFSAAAAQYQELAGRGSAASSGLVAELQQQRLRLQAACALLAAGDLHSARRLLLVVLVALPYPDIPAPLAPAASFSSFFFSRLSEAHLFTLSLHLLIECYQALGDPASVLVLLQFAWPRYRATFAELTERHMAPASPTFALSALLPYITTPDIDMLEEFLYLESRGHKFQLAASSAAQSRPELLRLSIEDHLSSAAALEPTSRGVLLRFFGEQLSKCKDKDGAG